jgi:hypothetical protein
MQPAQNIETSLADRNNGRFVLPIFLPTGHTLPTFSEGQCRQIEHVSGIIKAAFQEDTEVRIELYVQPIVFSAVHPAGGANILLQKWQNVNVPVRAKRITI